MVWPGTQPGDDASDHDRGLAAGGELVVAGGHRADCWRRFIGRSAWLHSLHRSRPKAARRPPRAPRAARFDLLVVAFGDGMGIRRPAAPPGWCGWGRACRRSGAPPGCAAGTPTGPGHPARRPLARPAGTYRRRARVNYSGQQASSGVTRAGRREWAGLAVLALACLLYAMDLTVLHLAVPAISEDLRPSGTQLLWITDIYGFM